MRTVHTVILSKMFILILSLHAKLISILSKTNKKSILHASRIYYILDIHTVLHSKRSESPEQNYRRPLQDEDGTSEGSGLVSSLRGRLIWRKYKQTCKGRLVCVESGPLMLGQVNILLPIIMNLFIERKEINMKACMTHTIKAALSCSTSTSCLVLDIIFLWSIWLLILSG